MSQRLQRKDCSTLRRAHHTMPRQRCGEISHTILRVIFGHLDVSSMKWLPSNLPSEQTIWMVYIRGSWKEPIPRYHRLTPRIWLLWSPTEPEVTVDEAFANLNLLNTIKLPKNLANLTKDLPKSNYISNRGDSTALSLPPGSKKLVQSHQG